MADPAHESAELARVFQAVLLADGAKHAQNRLLADVLDQLRAAHAAAHFQMDEFAKIAGEVLLHLGVAIAQPPEIFLIKCLKLHRKPEILWTIISLVDRPL